MPLGGTYVVCRDVVPVSAPLLPSSSDHLTGRSTDTISGWPLKVVTADGGAANITLTVFGAIGGAVDVVAVP